MAGRHADANDAAGIFNQLKVSVGQISVMRRNRIGIGMSGYEGLIVSVCDLRHLFN